MVVTALSIAGSDPSGGAGIQADLKAFFARGVYGCAVPTALTVQTARGVRGTKPVDPGQVANQVDAVLEDAGVRAVKLGMLVNAPIVRAVAKSLARYPDLPVVLDPVITSSSGSRLLDDHGLWAITEVLLPRARLVTPNADEASFLSRMPVRNEAEAREAALAIQALGAQAVLVKGGHLSAGPAADVLFDGVEFHIFESPRLDIPRTHGTGCLLSAVITAELAKGASTFDAVAAAKSAMVRALERGFMAAGNVLLPDPFALADVD
ncbi:MAG: bifunctional hydroxymethylpyrimidine kinase/phosphomethylpyrimidine kinase [Myxococcota bacterium]